MDKKLEEMTLDEIIFQSKHVKTFDSNATEEIETYILKLSEQPDAGEKDDEFNLEVLRILKKRAH